MRYLAGFMLQLFYYTRVITVLGITRGDLVSDHLSWYETVEAHLLDSQIDLGLHTSLGLEKPDVVLYQNTTVLVV